MPVVINKQTGLAENLPDGAALGPNYEIPLYDPEGQPISAPLEQASELVNQGFSQPTPDELKDLLNHAKYSSGIEQAKTFAENAASGATLGLSTAAQVGLGISKPEDIQARREVNPGTALAGEITGFAGSMFIPGGAAAQASKLGAKAASRIATDTALGRVGSVATKAGIENMVFQTGSEASKAFIADPNQSVETALTNIGLAGALGATVGGGIGAVPELWKLGPGKQVEKLLNGVKARSVGVDDALKQAADLDIPLELEAALAGDDAAKASIQHLMDSESKAGQKVREALTQFRNDADKQLVSLMGSTPEAAMDASEAAIGKTLKERLVTKFKSIYEPIAKQYDAVDTQFEQAALSKTQKDAVSNRIAELASEEGWIKSPGSAQNKLANRVLEELPLQQNALDLKRYITNLRESAPYGSENFVAAKKIINALKDVQEEAIGAKLLETNPLAIESYNALRGDYRTLMTKIDDLNDRLRVGRYNGPKDFFDNLAAMDPETIVKRLSPDGDVSTMNLLAQEYPELVDAIKQRELNKLLKGVAGKETDISPKKLFSKLDKLTPEMRSFLLNPEQTAQLDAIRKLVEAIPETTNPSGTARRLESLLSNKASTALGLATGVFADSLPGGVIVGYLSHLLGKEAPDAARLAYLKFLASDAAVDATGFKAMAAMAKYAIKGEEKVQKATASVFSKDSNVIKMPTAAERALLKKQVEQAQTNPEVLLNVGGTLGHYLPEHATALAATTARNLTYLSSIRPMQDALLPLDGAKKISSTEEAQYDRALDIAQNPLIILKDIKDGSLTLQDIQHLKAMYPSLYNRFATDVTEKLIEAKAKGEVIPYKTKLGISMFTGQPLESSMLPNSIMQNQGTFIPMRMPQQSTPPAKNMNKLDKLAPLYETSNQSRQKYRTTGHR